MKKISPEELSKFRLVKITYEHTLKEYELFERLLDDEESETGMAAHAHASAVVRKRNKLMDWIWAPADTIDDLVDILERYSMRHKITEHTSTYYRSPEKLSALRTEIDQWISRQISQDFVLDRISLVGIENITKLEKIYIENESKK